MSGQRGPDGLAWLAGELSAIRRELVPADESRALVLALDQGGTSSRAVLFDAVGREVATAHAPVATRRDGDDRVEHDAEELLRSLLTAATDACDSPLAAGRPLLAAGLATQRSTVCCWDRTDGAALAPAISWQDRRNAAWLAETLGSRSAWVRELTGLPLSPHYGASKLRWCLDELAAVRLARRDGRLALGPLASFLLHRLCAERPLLADPANASRTLLYDPALLDWSPALLEAFGVPAEVLPSCVGTVHDFGTVPLGSAPGRQVPLRACSGDQSAAVFAFGTPDPATASVNAGTGVFVQRVLRDPSARAPRGLLESVVYAEPGDAGAAWRCHEGTVNGGYAAVEWLARRTGFEARRALAALAAPGQAGRTGLLFMNGVGGLAAPWWQAGFPSEFVALPGRQDAAADELQQLAAVVESIAFLVAVNLRAMQQVAPLRRITLTGGLASCDYLCEALADATGLPVLRPLLREATARGIAWLAAGQPADWQPVPVEREFRPSANESFRARFAHWQDALEARLAR